MQILQRRGHLVDVVRRGDVVKAAVGLQKLVELAVDSVLQDQIHVCLVKEKAIQPADVRMHQGTLDLDLAPEVFLELQLHQVFLGHDFDGAD